MGRKQQQPVEQMSMLNEQQQQPQVQGQPQGQAQAQSQGQFVPYTTEQKREYGKQFTREQRISYRQGQRNAYGHMANIGRRNSNFINNNMKNDGVMPTTQPPANKPNGSK